MTGRDLVTASMRLIGAVAPGESISAQEASDALASLNRLIDSWSNESLLIYSIVQDEFSLVAGTQTYTMGTGGTFNSARPLKIKEAFIKVDSTTPAVEYPLRMMSLHEWASVRQKGLSTNIPTDIYTEATYPLETINIYPVPSVANKIVIYSEKQLSSITTLDTVLSLPPGYERALIYNFAAELGPEYGKEASQAVFLVAMESKASIKRTNHKRSYLRVDEAIAPQTRFNIYTGDSR